MLIKENYTIIFQGDSITDAERNCVDENSYGNGYCEMCSSILNNLYPDYNLKIINKGIAGNLTRDMKARWDKDCLDYKPDIVSIMAGINDVWCHYNGSNYITPIEQFTENYEYLMSSVKKKGAKLIIVEPFLFVVGEHIKDFFREDLDPKINAIRKLAEKYADIYIPMDGIFHSYLTKYKRDEILRDGVHPTILGHRMIAKEWLKLIQ